MISLKTVLMNTSPHYPCDWGIQLPLPHCSTVLEVKKKVPSTAVNFLERNQCFKLHLDPQAARVDHKAQISTAAERDVLYFLLFFFKFKQI